MTASGTVTFTVTTHVSKMEGKSGHTSGKAGLAVYIKVSEKSSRLIPYGKLHKNKLIPWLIPPTTTMLNAL